MKTLGTKLDNSDFEKFIEKCNGLGCSKSETMRNLIKNFIKNDFDFKDVPQLDHNDVGTTELMKTIIEQLPNADNISLKEDDYGKPLEAEIGWVYD